MNLLLAIVALLCYIGPSDSWIFACDNSCRPQAKILGASLIAVGLVTIPPIVDAVDCNQDCTRNCLKVAPGSAQYCKESCQEYCNQDDRTDGLSGSISNTGGETGIFGGSPVEGGSSVTREADRPPSLPKLIPDSMLKIPKVKST